MKQWLQPQLTTFSFLLSVIRNTLAAKLTERGRYITSTASSANSKLRVPGLGLTLLLLQLPGLHLLPELLLELLLPELPQLFGIRVFSRADGVAAVREGEFRGEDVSGEERVHGSE